MIRVWDPVVRALHWALAAAIALGWSTTAWLVEWHQAAGYAALVLVALRVVWGVAGPRRARFADFIRGPSATLRHARLLLRRREPRFVGHNPLGGWMVLALFGCIVALALTGWLYRTDRFWGDATVEALHEGVAWALVALVVLHVAGVAHASRRHRENLVAAMFSGRKRAPGGDDIA